MNDCLLRKQFTQPNLLDLKYVWFPYIKVSHIQPFWKQYLRKIPWHIYANGVYLDMRFTETPGALTVSRFSQMLPPGVVRTTRQSCAHAAGARSHSVNQANSHRFYPYAKTLTTRLKQLVVEIMLVYVLKLPGYYFLLLRNTDKNPNFCLYHPPTRKVGKMISLQHKWRF